MEAGTLSYTGLTRTGQFSPGQLAFDQELDPAHSGDTLSITRNVLGPDASHVAFLDGQVQFGRITSTALVDAAPVPGGGFSPFFSSLSTKFTDTLTISGASGGFLRLNFSLHGVLARSETSGASAIGTFDVFITDLGGNVTNEGIVCMTWEAGKAPILCAPLLAGVLAPLQAATTISPDGGGGSIYQGQATILFPFTSSSFGFAAQLTSQVSCTAPCAASADLGHTALIGGYQILDSSLNPIPGASLASASGYDYITPPGGAALSAQPVTNDFAGNGRSGALLYDPNSGQSYTALSNANGTYQYPGNLFTAHMNILRTGDFNGDGKSDLIMYNSQTALAYIGFGNGDGTFAFQSLFWSSAYNTVETGDINGDGKTDIVLYNSSTGTLYTGISNGSAGFTYLYHLVSQNFNFVRLADFTGDGKADLFLYNAANGAAFLGVGDGAGNFNFHGLFLSAGYSLADIGDLNGDGRMDVMLYNPASGNAATGISDSNGDGGFSFTPMLFSPGFTSVRLADYTGDGKADVTVYNKNNAAAYFGTGTGAGAFNFQSLFWSPGYDAVIPEDVNGDGEFDVILYNSATGTEYTGISNGNGTFSYTYQYWGIGKVLAK